MAKLNREWMVQPHDRPVMVDDGILSVAGTIEMPLGRFPRRTTAIRLASGGTAIWSAMPLDEAGMREIEALGRPRFLIVPNQGHRLDVAAWKARYPDAKVIAPPGAREAVTEAAAVDATQDVIGDPAIRFELVDGTKADEFALLVTREGRVTLILNDILSNVRHPEGLGATIMARLFGFGVKRPRTSWPVRRMFVADGKQVAAQFRRWAALPGLERIVVSHGDVIEDARAAALERAAADFD